MDLFSLSGDLGYAVIMIVGGIIKASNVIVKTGTTGLVYTFGRAGHKTLDQGLHMLIPFVQRARVVPTRSRTLDLPKQKIARTEGHVFLADANVVYRVVDIRRALIMVDDLVRGMEQMLTLGVQEVVRGAPLGDLRAGDTLDAALARNLEAKLEPWGVAIERAGFSSLAPTDRTLQITQLRPVTSERSRRAAELERGGGLTQQGALAAVGTQHIFRSKAFARRQAETRWLERRRLRASLEQRGWTGAAIARAFRALGATNLYAGTPIPGSRDSSTASKSGGRMKAAAQSVDSDTL